MPVDHTQIFHASLLVDDSFQHDNPLNARLLGERWIGWLYLPDQVRLLYVAANANSLGRFGRRWRGWRRRWRNRSGRAANDAANHTTNLATGNATGNSTNNSTHSCVGR